MLSSIFSVLLSAGIFPCISLTEGSCLIGVAGAAKVAAVAAKVSGIDVFLVMTLASVLTVCRKKIHESQIVCRSTFIF